ncbi:MAG: energy transducer TonB [Cytophagaceae bacterium]
MSKESINEIIFEKRNKEYGAYALRRAYGNYVTGALLIAATVFSLILIAPVAWNYFFGKEKGKEELVDVTMTMTEVDLPAPPPDEIVQPPQVVPPKEVEMIKNTEPDVQEDSKVKKDELANNQDLENSNPGDKTQEGVKQPLPVDPGPVKTEPPVVKIETWAEQMPEFPGGLSEYFKFVRKHIEYPQRELDEEREGTVKISFVVNVDGTITELKVAKSSGSQGFDEEALRVFRKMPAWKPAKKKNQVVPLRMTWPVVFDIAD